jgi:hypothetical protein
MTDGGYVFRTDLRLRPDPSVTPVCLAMEAAERYYESLGRTWERAAYIKARPCAGDIARGEAFLDGIAPFVWRRHLDYAAIQDAHDMRPAHPRAQGADGHGDAARTTTSSSPPAASARSSSSPRPASSSPAAATPTCACASTVRASPCWPRRAGSTASPP